MPRPKSRRPPPPAPAVDWRERDRQLRELGDWLRARYGAQAWIWTFAPPEVWTDPAAHHAWEARVAKAAAGPDGVEGLANAIMREQDAGLPPALRRNLHPIRARPPSAQAPDQEA